MIGLILACLPDFQIQNHYSAKDEDYNSDLGLVLTL